MRAYKFTAAVLASLIALSVAYFAFAPNIFTSRKFQNWEWFKSFFANDSNIKCPDCNIILISVDTLRADHMSLYGYLRLTTPFLDSLAKDAIVFRNHITSRPKTNPSLTSLFSGLYPIQNGVRWNHQILSENILTLPRILKQHNYKTAAVISNTVLIPKSSSLHRGFDIYDVELNQPELNRPAMFERNAEGTSSAALKILNNWKKDEKEKDKFFLWLHYIDPHGPYTAPSEDMRNRFKSKQEKLVKFKLLPSYQILPSIPVVNNLSNINLYVDQYDGEISYLDSQLQKLFKAIKDTGLLRNTMIIFTSDHGESLYEHEYYLEHGAELYDDNIKIPLIIRLPDNMSVPYRETTKLTSIVDVFPTILEFLDINMQSPFYLGQNLLKKSFLRKYTFSEDFSYDYERLAVVGADKKVIQYRKGRSSEFTIRCFDRNLDPAEINDLDCKEDGFQELIEQFGVYKGLENLEKSKDANLSNVDPERLKQLKTLGYLK